jgi:hypothetical protein
MPPVLGPWSPRQQALVVLRGQQGQGVRAVGDHEQRQLLPGHELLDQHLGARLAQRAVVHDVADGALGLVQRHGDDHALAGGEARGLDHHRRAERAGGRDGLAESVCMVAAAVGTPARA